MPDSEGKLAEKAKIKDGDEPNYKGLYIYPTDLNDHSYTTGCKGCEAVKAGRNKDGKSRAHNLECRNRIVSGFAKTSPTIRGSRNWITTQLNLSLIHI